MDTTITLPAGGKLHASRSHLCLAFEKTRFSLSTAIYGGGFKEINYAVNQKLETFYPSEDRFPGGSVPEFLRLSILENGYDPAKACALLTAAKMEWHSVKTFSHKELLLDAVTTGGAEKRRRAGSPPLYTEKRRSLLSCRYDQYHDQSEYFPSFRHHDAPSSRSLKGRRRLCRIWVSPM